MYEHRAIPHVTIEAIQGRELQVQACISVIFYFIELNLQQVVFCLYGFTHDNMARVTQKSYSTNIY
jgi:hypothetical protein